MCPWVRRDASVGTDPSWAFQLVPSVGVSKEALLRSDGEIVKIRVSIRKSG